MGKRIDYSKEVGKKYNSLSILEVKKERGGRPRCIAECKCGSLKEYNYFNVRYGKTTSCGCKQKELTVTRSSTHGDSGTRLYNIYKGIKSRCYNVNIAGYQNYGGRGIKVCRSWLDSYESFKRWAIKSGYDESLSIDRIDNNGNYEPANCRWVDRKTQTRNRSIAWKMEINGIIKSASEWCEDYGIDYKLAYGRKRRGWSDIDCLTKPKRN